MLEFTVKYNLNLKELPADYLVLEIIENLNLKIVEELTVLENTRSTSQTSQPQFDNLDDLLDQIDDQTFQFDVSDNANKSLELILSIKKDIQKLFYYAIIDNLKNIDFPVYVAHYYDFRGRIYPKSVIGFLFLKVIRPFYQQTCDFDEFGLTSSLYFKKLLEQKPIFPNNIQMLIRNDIDRYFFSILFLELGKLKKNILIKSNGVGLQEFIDMGVNIYFNSPEDEFELEDYAYYINIKQIIDDFCKNQVWSNGLIIRDSTASSFQH